MPEASAVTVVTLRAAARRVEDMLRARARAHGMGLSEALLLYGLWSHQGCASPPQVGAEVMLSPSAVRAAGGRLERRGMVERRAAADGRRRACLALTEQGERLAATVADFFVEVEGWMRAQLSEEQHRVLLQGLLLAGDPRGWWPS
ncbi:MAG: MarR family winged helix-turn-helix transcriptional regulator [Syntrophomonadaceae bacterium]|nr:MarR family winged helix-turn-helix transcriptional regulator [Syntrophomonadaceae bacterium]